VWRGWRGSNPRPLASEANTLSAPREDLLSESMGYDCQEHQTSSLTTS
jgi:hypothetical protein